MIYLWFIGYFLATAAGLSGIPREPAHDFHVSMARMAIENNQAVIQIRLFKDDLEAGMQQYFQDPELTLQVDPRTDSLFAAYLNTKLRVIQGERQLKGAVASSGEDELFGFPVWWYTLSYSSSEPIAALRIDHQVLMEMFEDQQNVLRVTRFPSEEESMYYLVAGASEVTISE